MWKRATWGCKKNSNWPWCVGIFLVNIKPHPRGHFFEGCPKNLLENVILISITPSGPGCKLLIWRLNCFQFHFFGTRDWSAYVADDFIFELVGVFLIAWAQHGDLLILRASLAVRGGFEPQQPVQRSWHDVFSAKPVTLRCNLEITWDYKGGTAWSLNTWMGEPYYVRYLRL